MTKIRATLTIDHLYRLAEQNYVDFELPDGGTLRVRIEDFVKLTIVEVKGSSLGQTNTKYMN